MEIEAALEKARAADDGMQEAHLLGDYDLAGGYTSASRAAEVAAGLGMSPEDVERPVKVLSGGLQMRANMARALMSRADVLMLDEPTNHLDLDAVLWLEGWLQRFQGTLAAGVTRPRVPRRHRGPHRQYREWPAHALDRQLHRFPAPACRQRAAVGGACGAPGARSGTPAFLHRTVPRQGQQGAPGAEPHQGAEQAGDHHDVPGDRNFRMGIRGGKQTTAAAGDTRWSIGRLRRAYRHHGRESLGEPGRAHRHPRAQRGRQVHAHETHLGRVAAVRMAIGSPLPT